MSFACGRSKLLICFDTVVPLCAVTSSLVSLFLLIVIVFIMKTQRSPATAIQERAKESKFALARENPLKKWTPPVMPLMTIEHRHPSPKPASGVKAEKGRRSKMEDTFTIEEDFLEITDDVDMLTQVVPFGMHPDDAKALIVEQPATPQYYDGWMEERRELLHYYAVYDGHGGSDASSHCASRMHENMREAWNNVSKCGRETDSTSESSFKESAMNDNNYHSTTSDAIAEMFERAFRVTDDEFKLTSENSAVVGSTAVVALVGERCILVGYCGDSRAVLCRNKKAYALTIDHKPEREDETERVQKAGGQVLFFNGPRVMGLLAMSRAIGDISLRPYVIPTPDVCILHRSPEDEVLILASDGLWDVLTNQEACTLALKCLQRARDKGATPSEATKLTATVLTRAAMDRGSRDNITVMVVDLRAQNSFVSSVPSYENDSPCNAPDNPREVENTVP